MTRTTITADQRAAVLALYAQGVPLKVIAARTGVKLSAASMIAYRANLTGRRPRGPAMRPGSARWRREDRALDALIAERLPTMPAKQRDRVAAVNKRRAG